jgi:hypothetical protein
MLCLPVSALALSACGSTVSTAGFKGEQHDVAQTVANLAAHATAAEEKKICGEDLAASVVKKLGGTKGCEAAVKSQLAEVDSLAVTVGSIQIAPDGTSATALVASIREGKSHPSTLALVKEDGKWKVSGLG